MASGEDERAAQERTQTDLGAAHDAPGAGRVHLVLRFSDRAELRSLVQGETLVVGRSNEAGLVVDDARVSRHHAELRNERGVIVVKDLGGRNATKLNGESFSNASVSASRGDVIAIGPLEIVVAATPGWQKSSPDEAPPSRSSDDVVVVDPAMAELYERVRRVAGAPTNVLVTGETGTGKEVIAERLHRWSSRATGPFVCLNCASLPDSLLESELFGHEKGAFTGASNAKAGHLEAARGGTVVLDEVGELPLGTQAKLLRVLEDKRVMRVGGREAVAIDVRVVSATNRDLRAEVAAGRFREDLYYRIAAFTIEIPPLRARPSEIVPLAKTFARRFAKATGAEVPELSDALAARLRAHTWPGNARELRNAIEHAMVLTDSGILDVTHLPGTFAQMPDPPVVLVAGDGPIRDRVADLERRSIEEALAKTGGNQGRAAELLGISRRGLLYKLAKIRKSRTP